MFTKLLKKGDMLIMKDSTRQVLILKNFSSPEIQQAIIILRGSTHENEAHIVAEAEQVIDNYMKKSRAGAEGPAGRVLAAVMIFGAAVLALAVYGGVELVGRLM
jgi:hypothetical protein